MWVGLPLVMFISFMFLSHRILLKQYSCPIPTVLARFVCPCGFFMTGPRSHRWPPLPAAWPPGAGSFLLRHNLLPPVTAAVPPAVVVSLLPELCFEVGVPFFLHQLFCIFFLPPLFCENRYRTKFCSDSSVTRRLKGRSTWYLKEEGGH